MDADENRLERITAYILGELNAEEARTVQELIATDPQWRELYETLLALRDEKSKQDWGALHGAAHALLDGLLADARRSAEKPEEKRGIMIFDSRLLPLAEGVRPALVDTRKLRYQIGEELLELSLYPVTMNSYEVIGQLQSEHRYGSLVVELRSGKKKLTITANQFGLFRFPRVPTAKYTLKLRADKVTVGTIEIEL